MCTPGILGQKESVQLLREPDPQVHCLNSYLSVERKKIGQTLTRKSVGRAKIVSITSIKGKLNPKLISVVWRKAKFEEAN